MNAVLTYVRSDSEWDLALDRAREVAARSGARIVLADVIPPRASPGIERSARERLEEIARPLRRADMPVDLAVRRGRPAAELTRLAVDRSCDLVLKTARPDDPEGTAAFGSVARQLLRMCPVPVWIIRRRPSDDRSVVLAAVDPTSDADRGDDLGTRVLREAQHIAKLEAAELHVVHAWRPYGEVTLSSPLLGRPAEDLHAYEIRVARDASRDLTALLRANADIAAKARVHFHKGDPPEVISAVATDIRADVIVLGTVARRGMAGFMVGNTAERVLRVTRTSVLAVKPTGFVSPLLRVSRSSAA